MYLKFLPDNSVGYISDKKIEKMFEDVINTLKAPLYQPATDTFFYRTLNNGSNNIVVMCDIDGKLITDANNNYYTLTNSVWSEQSNPSVTLIQNAGGTTLVEIITDENSKTLALDVYIVVINQNGLVTSGKVARFPGDPIEVRGKVQVFANPECTKYADGKSNEVWVRLNQGFGFGESESWGNPNFSESNCVIVTPSSEDHNPYEVIMWTDYTSLNTNPNRTTPFESGEIVYCNIPPQYFDPTFLVNPQVIFE